MPVYRRPPPPRNVQIYALDHRNCDSLVAHYDQSNTNPINIGTFFNWLDLFLHVGLYAAQRSSTRPPPDPEDNNAAEDCDSVTNDRCGIYLADPETHEVYPNRPALQDLPEDEPLPPGTYVITLRNDRSRRLQAWCYVEEPIDERLTSQGSSSSSASPRRPGFQQSVRLRDEFACCVCDYAPRDVRMQACHIFPRSSLSKFREYGFNDIVTMSPWCKDSRIDSIQNGVLLCSRCHEAWDNHNISVDVDAGYRIRTFDPANAYVGGNVFAMNGATDTRPHDDLLRWHLRRAVLTKVKARGEKDSSTTSDDDDDISISDLASQDLSDTRKWVENSKGKRYLEIFLGNRLNHLVPV